MLSGVCGTTYLSIYMILNILRVLVFHQLLKTHLFAANSGASDLLFERRINLHIHLITYHITAFFSFR